MLLSDHYGGPLRHQSSKLDTALISSISRVSRDSIWKTSFTTTYVRVNYEKFFVLKSTLIEEIAQNLLLNVRFSLLQPYFVGNFFPTANSLPYL